MRRAAAAFAGLRLHLERRMMNGVLAGQPRAQVPQGLLRIDPGIVDHMGRQAGLAVRYAPDVQVVHVEHARIVLQQAADRLDVHLARNAFQQHVHALAEQGPGARQHPEADGHGHRRVHPGPAGEVDDDGAGDDAHRPQQVGPDFQVGALDVQALLPPARQQAHADEVDGQPRRGDRQHGQRLHLGRRREAPVGLVQHIARDAEEQQGVERGRQDLEAGVAEGPRVVGRAPAQADGQQRDAQGHRVGEHMRGIRQQRQAAAPEAARHLHQQKARGEQQGLLQRAFMGVGAMVVSGRHAQCPPAAGAGSSLAGSAGCASSRRWARL